MGFQGVGKKFYSFYTPHLSMEMRTELFREDKDAIVYKMIEILPIHI